MPELGVPGAPPPTFLADQLTLFRPGWQILAILYYRSVSCEWAGPVFGRIEGAAGQWRRAALLLAHPVLGRHLHPC